MLMTFSFKVKLNKASRLLLLPLNGYPYRSVILRKICKISPISMVVSISLPVCLFVCLLFFPEQVLSWQKNVKNDLERFCYSSFNGFMLDSTTLAFKVKHFSGMNSDRAKIRNMTYIDFDNCHRITSLRMLYYLTLTYICKVNIFES